jgi:hypothetical protein
MAEGRCAECDAETVPHAGPGVPITTPGVLHHRDCPTLAWMTLTPEQEAELRRQFDAIRESERQAWINGHNYLIGSAQ